MRHLTPRRAPARLLISTLVAALLCAMAPSASAEPDALAEAHAAYDTGRWDDAIAIYERVYADSSSTKRTRAEAALEWSSILWEQGHYTKARERGEEALEIARAERFDDLAGRLLLTLGHVDVGSGKLGSAERMFGLCMSLASEIGDPSYGALCRINQSYVRQLRGKKGLSSSSMQQEINKIKQIGTPLTTGSALAKSAELSIRAGDTARALGLLESAQAAFVEAGSVPAQARNRLRIATTLQDAGQFDRARAHLKMATGPLQKMGNRPALVTAHGLAGRDAEHRGQIDEAVGDYTKALSLAKATGNPQQQAQSHLALCETLSRAQRAGAEHHCTQAANGFERVHSPVLEARARLASANALQAQGQLDAARPLYKRAIELLESAQGAQRGDRASIATQRANLCQIEQTMGVTGALLTCRAAIDALEALEALPDARGQYLPYLATTYHRAGFAAQSEKRIKQAIRFFDRAAESFTKGDQPDYVRAADAHLRLALIWSVVDGGSPRAERAFNQGIALLDAPERASLRGASVMATQLRQQRVQWLLDELRWADGATRAAEFASWSEKAGDRASEAWAYNAEARAHIKLGDAARAKRALTKGVVAARASGDAALARSLDEHLKKMK